MGAPGQILIIEDDPDGLQSVKEAVEDAGHAVTAAETGEEGVRLFGEQEFDAVLSDLVLPDFDGVEVLGRLHRINDRVPVLIMTAYGSVPTAVRALQDGAYDYILKPLDLDGLQSKLARAVETSRLRTEVRSLRTTVADRYSATAMVAGSGSMQDVLRQIASVAGTDATVHVQGESGTGKELVARALHVDGKRAAGAFVAVNCGAIAEGLLESELFGHEKGAFTGATAARKGAFERADGGTLFLDEIGIAPMSVQAKLLRALEEREILRVGGQSPLHVDVRVLSASNRDLNDLVSEKEFRPDLLYRLQVVTIGLPPLRDRREDIRALVDRFVATACADHGRHIDSIDADYYRALESREWPGNIRELRNVVEASVIMARDANLSAADVRPASGIAGQEEGATFPAGMTLADIEKQAVLECLRRNKGNRTLTADELGVSVRTVQRKIVQYELPF